MKIRTSCIVGVVLAATLGGGFAGAAWPGREYSAAPLAGRVVDAASGEGLPGVVVLAQWVLQGGLEGGNYVGALEIRETVTDAAGRYAFPGWGPKRARVDGRPGVLEARDPQLFLMKGGYAYAVLFNDLPGPPDWDTPVRVSIWNGRDIRLASLAGDLRAQQEAYEHFVLVPPLGIAGAGCLWRGMPMTVGFLFHERARLRDRGARVSDFVLVDERCALPAWFKELPQ